MFGCLVGELVRLVLEDAELLLVGSLASRWIGGAWLAQAGWQAGRLFLSGWFGRRLVGLLLVDGWSVGWSVSWSVGWLVLGRSVGSQVAWLVDRRLVGCWLPRRLALLVDWLVGFIGWLASWLVPCQLDWLVGCWLHGWLSGLWLVGWPLVE